MTPLAQLKSILNEEYVSEDGDKYTVELKPGLTDEEINHLAKHLPQGKVPDDVRELLKFASGFKFYMPEEVTFDRIGQFGLEDIFPTSVEIAEDGFGNFWVVDVLGSGQWGHVFFVCHDPAVVVKHSEDISEFIKHIHEYGKKGQQSNLDLIHEDISFRISRSDSCFIEHSVALSSADEQLKAFAKLVPGHFVIADLRNKPIQSGFAWGKWSPKLRIIRHETELIWALEKKERKGFFAKLFGR